MGRERSWDDAFTVLCERCGYRLHELIASGASGEAVCPECGRGVEASLPSARVGTAWQRGRGARSYLVTAAGVLGAPMRTFAVARVSGADGVGLAWTGGWLSGALIGVGTGGAASAVFARVDELSGVIMLGLAPFAGLVGAVVVVWLTGFEAFGLRRWGALRGRRISHAVSWTITGHASCAWPIASAGFAVLVASAAWGAGGPAAVGGIAMAAGFLWFEVLAYVGARRMGWANASGASGAVAGSEN